MKGPYQFKGATLVHVPSGRMVGKAENNTLYIYNPSGKYGACPADKLAAMKALRKLQAQLNSKALLDQMGIY